MPLLVNSVPNLAQGVSQQPDNLRYPGQCDEQINAWATVVEGLVKRPPTTYTKKIDSSDPGANLFTHFVKRDEDNKYCVTVSLGGVGVINLEDGTNYPVTVTSIATSYLSGITNPLADLRALTVADYTFLVNNKKEVAKDTTTLSQVPDDEAIIFVKLGDYEKAYSIYVDDSLVPLVSTLQGSDQHDYHDYTNTNHINPRLQEATYISGPASVAGGGSFADTEYIARDLYNCLEEELGSGSTLVGIDSVDILTVGTGYGNYSDRPAGFLSDSNVYKIEVEITQSDLTGLIIASALGLGTINSSGELTDVEIVRKGSNFNPANPFDFTVREYLDAGGGVWKIYRSASPTPPTFDTPVTSSRSSLEIERNGSVIRLRSNDGPFKVRVADGLSNEGLGLVYREVTSITDLPKSCFKDFTVKVIGDADIDQDDYFVKFSTKEKEEFGEGTWVEVAGWTSDGTATDELEAIPIKLDRETMPITLVPVLNGSGDISSFKLQSPEEDKNSKAPAEDGWRTRKAGNDETNPFPSFVGSTINDVFFFKNRLGFLTDSNVVFSEADEYFNFFRTTTQQLLDSAPIDVGLSHTKVAVLQHAVPFQEKLMLFSKQSQFVLRGADILSPKTVAISPVTEYDISDSVQPIALGNYIYFTFRRNDFEGMYEYFVDNNTETFHSEEITSQIPKYITKQVEKIAGSQAENTIVVGTSGDRNTLFVYKYFWSNKEKIQSAWMKFTFGREIRGFDFIDSNLHLFTKDDDGLHLEKLTLEDGIKDAGLDYTLYLDSKIDGSKLTTSYDAADKTTTISGFPYDPEDVTVYTKNGHNVAFTRTSATAGTVGGDLTSIDFVAGIPYNMLYRFSDQTLKQPTERGGRSASDYAFQTIRNGSINYAETGHFTVEVTPKYRDKYTYAFNPDILGANLTLNAFTPQDGHFRFPVQCQPNDAKIEVVTDSALPVKLLAAEFESMMIPRSRRYGA